MTRIVRRSAGPARAASTLAAVVLTSAVSAIALAGCGSDRPHAAPSASPTTMTEQQILAIGQQYAQCLRDHGVTNFPDPVVTDGRLAMPQGSDGDSAKRALQANKPAQDACQPIQDRLPASARKHAPPSAADLQALLKFAQCLRQHGVPEWPDPAADGTFPLIGTPLETEGKSPRTVAAMQACRQYWDKGISVK